MEQGRQRNVTIVTDLADRVIAGAVQRDGASGVFRFADYTLADGTSGQMLGCGGMTAAKPVTIRLGAHGRFRIWLGIRRWEFRGPGTPQSPYQLPNSPPSVLYKLLFWGNLGERA